MKKKQEIIIGYFRLGMSKRQLSKELNISRNTVKRYIEEHKKQLLSKPANLIDAGIINVPTYNSDRRRSMVLTDEIKELIRGYLKSNNKKIETGKSKQQMAGTDIHEALKQSGHIISYPTVIRFIRREKKKSAEVFIRQEYSPGQSTEFDWGYVKIEIAGTQKNVMMAVFTSSYSNHRWAYLFYRQDMSSFLESHVKYFSFLGVVPTEMVYDNMRTAIKKFALRNADKKPTDEFLALSIYYQFGYRFCNARRGNEKGHVERSVEFVRRKAFAKKDQFTSLEEANQYLMTVCTKLNNQPVKGQKNSIAEQFKKEVPLMKSAPPVPYDTSEIRHLRVDKYSTIRIDTNSYSVQEGYVGEILSVKVYPDKIKAYNNDNQLIAEHERHHSKFKYYLKLEHFLKTFRTKPGALLGSTTYKQADQALKDIYEKYFLQNPKSFMDLLILKKEKNYSIQQIQEAIAKSIEARPHHPLCLDHLSYLLMPSVQQQNQINSEPQNFSKQISEQCDAQLKKIQNQFPNL